MRVVHDPPEFWQTVASAPFDQIRLADAITRFIDWQRSGVAPIPPFRQDKSSAADDQGVVYQPYKRNYVRHCHLGFRPNGDPLLAYRALPNGELQLIAVTTHDEMFNPQKRNAFVVKHSAQLPSTKKRK